MLKTDITEQFKTIDTPFFFYDLELLNRTLKQVQTHALANGFHVHFALKANNNKRILSIMKQAGLGADCVSGNEVLTAVDAGFAPDDIAFAGVGKTDREIEIGIEHDVFCFNIESVQELKVINEIAGRLEKTARVALRVNPNVDANTHKYITTGLKENKFGINEDDLEDVLELIPGLNHIQLIGLHFHIGSQITEMTPFQNLCNKANELNKYIAAKGFELNHLNAGGGFGIDYHHPDSNPIPDFDKFFGLFNQHMDLLPGQKLHFELGRSIVGQCGSLISKVLYIKKGKTTNFAILDAGMSELIRPALYEAEHRIDVLTSSKPGVTYDVVGPICETSDTFRTKLELPELQRGDLVAIRSVGAYGQVMLSRYNLRPEAGTYFSDDFN